MVLIVSGDVGGARAACAVVGELIARGADCAIVEHGALAREAPATCARLPGSKSEPISAAEGAIARGEISLLVFTSSLVDAVPLRIARRCRKAGVPVVHLLDNWMNYRERLETDGGPVLLPDVYAVMDDAAFQAAAGSGIPESILRVTGHPALASLAGDYSSFDRAAGSAELGLGGFDPGKKLVVFVSEAVKAFQGEDPARPDYRGYTEETVLESLCQTLALRRHDIQLGIVPHPSERIESLRASWERSRGGLSGGILSFPAGRKAVFLADFVVGMSSLLLYEAWLIGKPVLSLQPGLRRPELAFLSDRDGVRCVVDPDSASAETLEWLSGMIAAERVHAVRPELASHRQAPAAVADIIESMLGARCL